MKLTNDQKRILAQLARRAFNKLRAMAIGRGETFPMEHDAAGEPIDPLLWNEKDFRHHHVAVACHKDGLKCCSQEDYAAVKGRFLHLLGEDGKAVKVLVHGETNAKRIAEYKLLKELRRAGLSNGYAESICRNMFHCTVADATDKQIWKLIFTIRNRASAKRKVAREGAKEAKV